MRGATPQAAGRRVMSSGVHHGDRTEVRSDPRIPFIAAIFPIAAVAAMKVGEALH
jgi:hypothetical protein